MASPRQEAPLDYLALGESLETLGYPVRLGLLDALRFPHQLKDIRLTPHRVRRDSSPDRPVARQTIQAHLRLLLDQGLVHMETRGEGAKAITYYTANPTRLYAIAEDVRRLSLRHAGTGHGTDITGSLDLAAYAPRLVGPRLVLVHGVYEGRAFQLASDTAKDGSWTIGRHKDVAVALDYDPYVSGRNTVVERSGDGFTLRDLAGNKNGTKLNWRALAPGGTERLRSGDVLGVGRSLLVFVEK